MSNDDRASSKIPKLVIPKVILKGHANEEIPSGTKLLPSDHSTRLPQPLHSTDVDSLQVFQLFASVLGRLHADLETFVDMYLITIKDITVSLRLSPRSASNIDVVDKKRDTLQILLSQGEQLGRLDSVCAWIPWLGEAFTAVVLGGRHGCL